MVNIQSALARMSVTGQSFVAKLRSTCHYYDVHDLGFSPLTGNRFVQIVSDEGLAHNIPTSKLIECYEVAPNRKPKTTGPKVKEEETPNSHAVQYGLSQVDLASTSYARVVKSIEDKIKNSIEEGLDSIRSLSISIEGDFYISQVDGIGTFKVK